MLIPNRHSGYIAGIRVYPGKGSSAPSPDPLVGQALMKQSQTADDLMKFITKSYEENKPLLDETSRLNNAATQQQMDLASKASDRADEAYSFYQTEGKPVVSKALSDSMTWDSASNLGKVRSQAAADVGMQFDNAQKQQSRTLQRMGINPSSSKFASLNNQVMMQKAAATAGATSAAQENRLSQGVQMRQQGSNIANGLSANSSGFSGQSSGMTSAGVSSGNLNYANTLQGQNAMVSGMNTVGGTYGNVVSGGNASYANQLQANAQNNANSPWGGIGNIVGQFAGSSGGSAAIAGLMADGGPVNGPGTGTSDSVPAVNTSNGQKIQLSNGEYVIPADVVRAKGSEFFDKLIASHHKPVNVGRTA